MCFRRRKMFKLISEYGNEIVLTDDTAKIERLLKLGFRICEEPKKNKESKNTEGRNEKGIQEPKEVKNSKNK